MKDKVIKAINEKFIKLGSVLRIINEDDNLVIVIIDPLIKQGSYANFQDKVWDLIDETVHKDLKIEHDIIYNNTGRIFWCYDKKK